MPAIRLNQNRKWQVNNFDDWGGNIVDCYGVDLSNIHPFESDRGAVVQGGKLWPHTTQANASGISSTFTSFLFSDAGGSAYGGGSIYFAALNSGRLFTASSISSHFVQDSVTGSPTTIVGDLIVFGQESGTDRLLAPTGVNIAKLVNGTWTSTWWSVTLGQSNLKSVYHPMALFRQPYLLLIGDGNLLHTVDQNLNVKNSRVTLPYNHTIQWIRVTESRIYLGVKINQFSHPGVWEYDPINETAYFFPLDTIGNNIGPGFIDQNMLMIFDTDGRIKRFTGNGFELVADTAVSKKASTQAVASSLKMDRNGAVAINNRYYFLLSGSDPGIWLGLYVYEKETGNFYCKYTITYGATTANVMLAQNCGALFFDGTNFLASVFDYNNDTTTGIYSDTNPFTVTTKAYRGWLTTPKIPAQSIQDSFEKLWAIYNMFGTDSFGVKVRNSRLQNRCLPTDGSSASGTWSSGTVFTTTNAQIAAAVAGQEVVVIYGQGAGMSTHITSIVTASGTSTITVEDSIGNASQAFQFQVTPFIEMTALADINKQSDSSPVPASINDCEWIQFKIELRGQTPILSDLFLEFSQAIYLT
ncbi:MAG: hypothetical protein M1275_03195 [Patescibacteria group bacterium]|nr:hypothetical protein [Patescibacteria group bacterium]